MKRKNTSFFEYLLEVFGWLQIVLSPTLAAFVIGFVIYLYNPSTVGVAVVVSTTAVGLLIGVIWATKVWKGKGTIWFLSRLFDSHKPDENTNKGKPN
ncbi:hypothetical protein GC194_10550 [bacterium]|nr:hypothetical protein [bacterium]